AAVARAVGRVLAYHEAVALEPAQLRIDLPVARCPEEAGGAVDDSLDVVPGARRFCQEPQHDRRNRCPLRRHVSLRYIATIEKSTGRFRGRLHMRWRGLEPPRGLNPTRPSTLRVYQFRHQRAPSIVAARLVFFGCGSSAT